MACVILPIKPLSPLLYRQPPTSSGCTTLLLTTTQQPAHTRYDFDPVDVTKTWPEDVFPLQPVGRMVLNANPDNFFAENEQLAFCPALVVPGALQYWQWLCRACVCVGVHTELLLLLCYQS